MISKIGSMKPYIYILYYAGIAYVLWHIIQITGLLAYQLDLWLKWIK